MTTKSSLYIHKFREVSVDPNEFELYASVGEDPYYHDEIRECKEALIAELLIIMETELTPYQQKILQMKMDGLTQYEIAEQLGITQSAVCKSIRGNIVYPSKRTEGGIIKKIKKAICKNKKILNLLIQLEDKMRERD